MTLTSPPNPKALSAQSNSSWTRPRVGPVVRESIKRHYENLERLAASLRKLGMDDSTVDENITQVFHEYERELVNYMTAR